MHLIAPVLIFLFFFRPSIGLTQENTDSLFIRRIFDAALTESDCYNVLEHLCTKIGPRLSGSRGAAEAVSYMNAVMQGYKFDKVILQDVMVPHWERGKINETYIKNGDKKYPLSVSALGGSVGTPGEGILSGVVEVKNFEELERLGRNNIQGKIVFFSRAFDAKHIYTFNAYAGCVDQRGSGASQAAKYGAAAVIVRSMTHLHDDHPHTGAMHYDTLFPRIPAIAVSTKDSDFLSRMLKENPDLKLFMKMDCRMLPDTLSHNVVGQINGTVFPDEFIITGGHLDAWDNGQGAHDDGAGCVQSIEALRILRNLGFKPKHSLRAVNFMNEENGLRGGLKYAELAKENHERHRFAIESDRGGFTPRGFSIDAGKDTIDFVKRFKNLLEPYGLNEIIKGGSGADIGPLKKQGAICIGYIPDSQRYFDYHHAETDRFEAVNKRELELGAAAIATLMYLADKYWESPVNPE